MGVKGLSSLLEDNSNIYSNIKFSNSKLVVDGCNLAYYLYNMANLDQNHGGEYLAFQAVVQAFFKTLKNCEIKAYVVIDGGLGTSDGQLITRMSRQSTLLENIPAALTGEKKGIYPPFVMSVFEQTLNDLTVPQVRCFGEADGRLAAEARQFSCPVLSGDTDFYIYDLPGVLPLAPFWESVKDSPASSEIRCKLYTTTKFCTEFNINHQLLPFFASLVKVDHVKLRDVKWARFLPAGSPKMKFNAANLMGILSWLRARAEWTTEDTLTAVMALIPNMSQDDQTEVKNMLRDSMLEYKLPSSPAPLFSKGTVQQLPAKLSSVPELVPASLARGDLGANILDYDILVHRRKFLRIQVERSDLKSSNLTSRPIRQVLYGLLLGQGGGEVEEVDRVGTKPASVKVQPLVHGAAKTLRLDSLIRVGLDPDKVKVKQAVEHQRPRLDSLSQADPAVRLQVCLETLGVEEETLEGVPAHLRLPVAVTCYWLRMASPEPTVLKALLMVMVEGELIRQNDKKAKNDKKAGWQGDTEHLSKPLDGVVAHSFNQWQACLKDASQLNLLLCKPLPEPHYAWLYQGRLVHQRQKELQKKEPEDIVQDDKFRDLYRGLLRAVTQPDPGADRRAGGPEAQLGASMEHLHLNTQDSGGEWKKAQDRKKERRDKTDRLAEGHQPQPSTSSWSRGSQLQPAQPAAAHATPQAKWVRGGPKPS